MYILERASELPADRWAMLTDDVAALIAAKNRTHDTIRGPYGEGAPIVTTQTIIFNGNAAHHTWSTRRAAAGKRPATPSTDDDAHEDFILVRRHNTDRPTAYRLVMDTGGKPYTGLVICALLLVRHHFPAITRIVQHDATADQVYRAIVAIRTLRPGAKITSDWVPPPLHAAYRTATARDTND